MTTVVSGPVALFLYVPLLLYFPFSSLALSAHKDLLSQVSIIELRDKYQCYVCNVDEHVN